ncbi:hypothetical protein FHS57_000403 [Runella defluvii]|uniref:Glycosyltransferase family 1 protein n=1 Tax=Runella defluvii TaxID=370973 RepID=A0A7W5ZFT4_9BACT|nr:glycosyltransferase family 1 protein [Runella defluvii]MBB3836421.1 hypothetical protein [Runella defluvii]
MRILFITSTEQDYLADSLLHGFRSIYGYNCIDYPKCDFLYKNYQSFDNKIYGEGFTLYNGLLNDAPIDRLNIDTKIKKEYFDLIVISNIQRQFGFFLQYRPWLNYKNTIIIDGDDTPKPYPMRGIWLKHYYYWFLPRANKDFLYFKREWTTETHFNIYKALSPSFVKVMYKFDKNLRKISFSIPKEKIINQLPIKTKDFPRHIVDKEVAQYINEARDKYVFSNENDYYLDLQSSRFGITTKREGWDCMRHYEIAANGAVPCFLQLNKKNINCAPHGLDNSNSIIYQNYQDLIKQINKLSNDDYQSIQSNALKWIHSQTTEVRVKEIINTFKIK